MFGHLDLGGNELLSEELFDSWSGIAHRREIDDRKIDTSARAAHVEEVSRPLGSALTCVRAG